MTLADACYINFSVAYTRSGFDENPSPALNLWYLADQAIYYMFHGNADFQYGLKLPWDDALDQIDHPLMVPSIRLQRFLEDFVQYYTDHRRFVRIACSLDTVLQNSLAHTTKRISDCRSGDEMVWMEDDHVVIVVNCALTARSEVTDDMDVRALFARSIVPRFAKSDRLDLFRFLILNQEDLYVVRDCSLLKLLEGGGI